MPNPRPRFAPGWPTGVPYMVARFRNGGGLDVIAHGRLYPRGPRPPWPTRERRRVAHGLPMPTTRRPTREHPPPAPHRATTGRPSRRWGGVSGPIVHFDYPGDDGETLARWSVRRSSWTFYRHHAGVFSKVDA